MKKYLSSNCLKKLNTLSRNIKNDFDKKIAL